MFIFLLIRLDVNHLQHQILFAKDSIKVIVRDIEKKETCMYTVFPKINWNTKPHINNEWVFFLNTHCFSKQWLNSKNWKYICVFMYRYIWEFMWSKYLEFYVFAMLQLIIHTIIVWGFKGSFGVFFTLIPLRAFLSY